MMWAKMESVTHSGIADGTLWIDAGAGELDLPFVYVILWIGTSIVGRKYLGRNQENFSPTDM